MSNKLLSLLILLIGLPAFLLSGEQTYKIKLDEELSLCRQCNLTRLNYIHHAIKAEKVDSIK